MAPFGRIAWLTSLKFHQLRRQIFWFRLRKIYREQLLNSPKEAELPILENGGMTCPSYPPEPGNQILAKIDPHTGISNFGETIRLGESNEVLNPAPPVEHFRYCGPCRTHGCAHWTGASCRLAESVSRVRIPIRTEVPDCSIRASCRWYAENGFTACSGCGWIEYRAISENATGRNA